MIMLWTTRSCPSAPAYNEALVDVQTDQSVDGESAAATRALGSHRDDKAEPARIRSAGPFRRIKSSPTSAAARAPATPYNAA